VCERVAGMGRGGRMATVGLAYIRASYAGRQGPDGMDWE